MIDPLEGTARRFSLTRLGSEVPLYQIVAGKKYLWFRGRRADGRLYRVDRLDLVDRGLLLELERKEAYELEAAEGETGAEG